MLAPIMTPTDWVRVSSPAFTKLTTITVVALDDWIMPVTKAPVSTRLRGLEVMALNMERILSPATFCNESLIIFIPNRKSPSEPVNVRIFFKISMEGVFLTAQKYAGILRCQKIVITTLLIIV